MDHRHCADCHRLRGRRFPRGGAGAGRLVPDRPIKFIVPYGPGGTVDPTARTLAMRAAEILGQAVVVENKPGAAGSIGTDFVVRAPADGYSVLIHTNVVTSEPWLKPDAELQLPEGHDAAPDDRRDAVRRARAPVAAGQLGEGAGRLREGASGQAQLRGVGHRVVGASARRAVPARNRHQAGLRSLRGWRCHVARPPEQRDPGRLRHAARLDRP